MTLPKVFTDAVREWFDEYGRVECTQKLALIRQGQGREREGKQLLPKAVMIL